MPEPIHYGCGVAECGAEDNGTESVTQRGQFVTCHACQEIVIEHIVRITEVWCEPVRNSERDQLRLMLYGR